MRLLTDFAALGLVASTAAKMTFINPSQFTNKLKVSEHDVWVLGQTIDLRWSQPDKGRKLSVVLYQMNSTMAESFNGQFPGDDPPFEFITHDQVDATFFRWIVGTTKDLRFSNQFAIAVWAEGTIVTDSATNIFNITNAVTSAGETVTTKSSSVGSGSSQTLPSSSQITSSAPPPASEPPSSGLSAGASAGIGVASTIVVIALAAFAWVFLHRRAKRSKPENLALERAEMGPPSAGENEALEKVTYYQGQSPISPSSELGTQTRVEMPPETADRHELL